MSATPQFKDNQPLILPLTTSKIVEKAKIIHAAPSSWAWHNDEAPRLPCLCGQYHGYREIK